MSQEIQSLTLQKVKPNEIAEVETTKLDWTEYYDLEAPREFSSIGQLKEVCPEMYDLILETIGLQVMSSMRHHQDTIKKMNREARNT